uniref:transcription factor JunB-like n=1 Tax=Myxine glutinosa TaxID=7769 RepID=UPI0035902C1F
MEAPFYHDDSLGPSFSPGPASLPPTKTLRPSEFPLLFTGSEGAPPGGNAAPPRLDPLDLERLLPGPEPLSALLCGAFASDTDSVAFFARTLQEELQRHESGPHYAPIPPPPGPFVSEVGALYGAPPAGPPPHYGGFCGSGSEAASPGRVSTHGTTPRMLKEEPLQMVPESRAMPGSLGSLGPIDLEEQEIMKVERKRHRNRIAATRCRRRKLERIARLQDKVASLKAQNVTLENQAGLLREHVGRLKRRVLGHIDRGCHLALNAHTVQAF